MPTTVTSDISVTTAWVTLTAYSVGDKRANDTAPVKSYICTTAGTSGVTGPTGTGTGISDATCVWDYKHDIDYSTLQAWEDASPANLVSDDKVWRGETWNDSTFSGGAAILLTLSGITTDATRYVELTAAATQSFQDHASVRTNPLIHDQTKGVLLTNIGNYIISTINDKLDYTRISRLQVYRNNVNGVCYSVDSSTFTDSHTRLKDMLCVTNSTEVIGGGKAAGLHMYGTSTLINCAVILTAATGDGVLLGGTSPSTMIGCTVTRTSNNSPAGIGVAVGGSALEAIVQSTAVFGFTTPFRTDLDTYFDLTNSKFNATDVAATSAPGSSPQHSVTYSSATPFTDADNTGTDFRAIASTSLAANGFRDVTNAPNDISGYARTATPTIGAWELTVAAAGGVKNRLFLIGVG